jgi:hypothetical protein
MAATMVTLPMEILETILRCLIKERVEVVRETMLGPLETVQAATTWTDSLPCVTQHFTATLRVCQGWSRIGLPILWTDVVLSNTRLVNFTSPVTPQNAALIWSLTLQSVTVRNRQAPFEFITDATRAHCLDLEVLAETLPLLQNLKTFSLLCGHYNGRNRLYLPRHVMCSIFQKLPSSVEELQVDTRRSEMESEHVCGFIGQLLPRMTSVELCLRTFCPRLFDVALSLKAPANNADSTKDN